MRRGLVARQGERPPSTPDCAHICLFWANGSEKLKGGPRKVVTLTKPLTAAILYRDCEQLPACQCLTGIIAVPPGSFGRLMGEETPFVCQHSFHEARCPLKPGWEMWMSAALLISLLIGSLLFQSKDPTHLCPAPPPFLIRQTGLTWIPGVSRKALGTVRQSRPAKPGNFAASCVGAHFSSIQPLIFSSRSPCLSCLLLFLCFWPTWAHISKATLLFLCYAEFLFFTSMTATSPTIFITVLSQMWPLCVMCMGLENVEALNGIPVHLRPIAIIQEPFLRIHMGDEPTWNPGKGQRQKARLIAFPCAERYGPMLIFTFFGYHPEPLHNF